MKICNAFPNVALLEMRSWSLTITNSLTLAFFPLHDSGSHWHVITPETFKIQAGIAAQQDIGSYWNTTAPENSPKSQPKSQYLDSKNSITLETQLFSILNLFHDQAPLHQKTLSDIQRNVRNPTFKNSYTFLELIYALGNWSTLDTQTTLDTNKLTYTLNPM